ncbi:OLC1v1019115C1 [Oldenlandia corymbosa var. corymbosa]|uniref:OLC1v1019115C1 n=1 Tax=Oldenlandia corymbosa var. corymbosa TaxID=529605 RepID=A0AAV1EDK6_OLDCO|nr:OLC1v1019115C1 [Oldenlandia corymbosa var. corymbosa]
MTLELKYVGGRVNYFDFIDEPNTTVESLKSYFDKAMLGDSTVQRLRGIDVYRIGPGDAGPLIGQCSNIIEEHGDCADDSGHDEYDIGDLDYGDDDSEYSGDSDGASASETDSGGFEFDYGGVEKIGIEVDYDYVDRDRVEDSNHDADDMDLEYREKADAAVCVQSVSPNKPTFQIRTHQDKHTCPTLDKTRNCTAYVVAKWYLEDSAVEPTLSLRFIKHRVKKDHGLKISRSQACGAKKKALDINKVPGLKIEARLMNIVKATTEEEWNKLMDDLKKKHEGAWRYLHEIGASHWCRSHFLTETKCNMLVNNICEGFNNVLNDGKESERPLDGQKRAAPKQRGRPRKWVAVEPLADDLRDEDENEHESLIPVSITNRKGKNQVPDGDENDPVVLVSRSKGKGKKQVLDGDENDPVVLVFRSENDPAILVSRTKRKEIQILVEDDNEDFPVIRVSRTRRKGKFQILDEYVGEDVPVTTTVDGEAENVVPEAEAWSYSALEQRADCSGNLDMDERKDQNEESLKENNRQLEDAENSVIAPVVEPQPHEDPNKVSPTMEMEEDQARNDQSHAFDFVVLNVTVIEKQMTLGQGERIRDKTRRTTLTIASNWVLVGHARPDNECKFEYVNILQHANGAGRSEKNSMQKRANHLALVRYLQDDLAPVPHADDRAEIPVPAVPHEEVVMDPLQSHNLQDRFVYPPMAIVVNLPRKLDCGKFVGLSDMVLREKYLFEGFNPTKVEPLWDDETGHLGIGIVHFRSGSNGLKDAIAFHQVYKNDHHEKQDWEGSGTHNNSLYTWVA